MEKCPTYHVPVLLRPCIEALVTRPDGVYADMTFGGGGHSRGILEALGPHGHLYSFDQDADAERNATQTGPEGRVFQDKERFTFVRSNFRYLKNWMRYYSPLTRSPKGECLASLESACGGDAYERLEKGMRGTTDDRQQTEPAAFCCLDGVLADLGVSSHHFDTEERGFSFRFDAPLDMRMNGRGGQTAADVLNTYDEERLTKIFQLYGEIRQGRALARNIIKRRQQQPLTTTGQLREMVNGNLLPQAFQALRIEVNHEMEALEEMLGAAIECLKPGGRLVVLTYHSLEDRMVKNFIKAGNVEGRVAQDFYGNRLTPLRAVNNKVIIPSAEEQEANPRSRSAKLRIAEKI